MSHHREAQRQQQLLQALWSSAPPEGLGLVGHAQPGLAVYRSNAGALAERALGAAFPVLAQLLGSESFAAMARHFWHEHPPQRGDLAEWGDELAAFVAAQAGLAGEPYLPDTARLEWAVHRAARAADKPSDVTGLALLEHTDPSTLRLRCADGCVLLESRWPVVSVWQAHQTSVGRPARFDAVREALRAQQPERAWVAREGWTVQVHAVPTNTEAFLRAVLARQNLAFALDAAGEGFDFEAWLIQALQRGWIAGIEA